MTSKTKIDCRMCGGDGHVAPYNDTQNTGPPTSVCPACKGSGRELTRNKESRPRVATTTKGGDRDAEHHGQVPR